MPHFEKRRRDRKRTSMEAKIIPADKSRTVAAATVVDLSPGGAKLSVRNPLAVPAEFTLVLPAFPRGRKSVIAWRGRSEVGVRFCEDEAVRPGPHRVFGKRPLAENDAG